MPNTTCDVLVVGSGPAGSSAAYEAAKKGFRTIMLEEDRVVGVPIQCGEGLSSRAFENLGLTPQDSFIARKIERLALFFPRDSQAFIRIAGFTLHRDVFDQYLAERAVDSGAKLLTSTKAIGCDRKNSVVTVASEGRGVEEIGFKMLIGCDGPKSKVAEWSGILQRETWVSGLIRAYELRIKGVKSDSFDFYIDPKISPGGYLWVFPKGDDFSDVGIATFATDSAARLEEFMKRMGFKGEVMKRIAGAIPVRGPLAKTYAERVVVAGDAAGQTNPVFFGGIHTAMLCGRLAGQTASEALENEDTSERFLKRYEDKWRALPLGDVSLLKAAGILYGLSEHELERLGSIVRGRDITHLGTMGKLGIFGSVLYPTNWTLLPRLRDLLLLLKGLKITRSWGW
jgi:digeranylgeranylglycerophospholipid reductase